MKSFLAINLSDQIEKDVLYNLFKTKQSDLNTELFSKLTNCKTNYDFFNLYTGVDLNSLFHVINELKSQISIIIIDNNIFKKNISYFTIISKIVISLQIINDLKNFLQDYLNKIKESSHIFFIRNEVNSKLKSQIKSCIGELLSQFNQKKNKKFEKNSMKSFLPKSIVDSTTFSEKENIIIKHKIANIVEDSPTPKFYKPPNSTRDFSTFLFSNDKNKNKITISKNSDNINERINLSFSLNNFKKNDSIFPILKLGKKEKIINLKRGCSCIKCNEKKNKNHNLKTKKNIEDNLNFSFGEDKNKNSKSCNNSKINSSNLITKTTSSDQKKIYLNNENFPKNNGKSYDMYFNLLRIINESYKSGLIHAEEKVELKQIIIAKTKFIFDIYQKFYLNTDIKDINNKKLLIEKLKKI